MGSKAPPIPPEQRGGKSRNAQQSSDHEMQFHDRERGVTRPNPASQHRGQDR